jgi:quercetin dioxygenase-like cupin family protein
MTASVLRAGSTRRVETPNAVMTTLASPSQGPTGELSVWRIEMRRGQQGPRHVFDREQVWHLVSGEADFAVGDETLRLRAGDTVILPARVERQVTAVEATEIIACGPGTAIASVPGEEAPRGTPEWIA